MKQEEKEEEEEEKNGIISCLRQNKKDGIEKE